MIGWDGCGIASHYEGYRPQKAKYLLDRFAQLIKLFPAFLFPYGDEYQLQKEYMAVSTGTTIQKHGGF